MRLVSFGARGSERPGLLLDDQVLDLRACAPGLPDSLRGILAAQRLGEVERLLRRGDFAAALLPLAGTRLGAPLPDASKIVCIGLNYADHASEQKRPLPTAPLLFAKATTALGGSGDPIVLPPGEKVDLEAELAFVVGRTAKRVRAEEAAGFIAGYMCFNDVSGRDAQFSDRQWFRGKSYDTFAPCGPCLVTTDEVADPHALGIASRVNGRLMQQSRTDQLVVRIPQLLEYITRSMTLLPGDIVATGTPAGVGVFRDPPVFLQDGDQVTVTIDSIGTLANPVRSESPL